MSLQTIYITRHGFRSNWVVERDSGVYHSHIPSPTGIPSDPALAGYGAQQASELAAFLVGLSPRVERLYSSPYYRCIQTLYPSLEGLSLIVKRNEAEQHAGSQMDSHPGLKIYAENGLGEWYGMAPFDHPSPAPPEILKKLFSSLEEGYQSAIVPSIKGETIEELHDRTAYALQRIIEHCDADGVRCIVICTHAATLYAVGRALTGRMPADVGEEDFRPFTCGLSKFVRRQQKRGAGESLQETPVEVWKGVGSPIPQTHWRSGLGVGGGWDCEINGDCSFLSGGEERGWRFSGDESFFNDDKQVDLDAGESLGVVVDGKMKGINLAPGVLPSSKKRALL